MAFPDAALPHPSSHEAPTLCTPVIRMQTQPTMPDTQDDTTSAAVATPASQRVIETQRGVLRTLDEPALRELIDQVNTARHEKRQLRIVGGGSKAFYGRPQPEYLADDQQLTTRALSGIVSYEPSELVITARAGTSLQEVEDTLARHGQYLAFEPPHFTPNSTVGGMVAAGLSGPARATRGAVRDFVLGTTLLNGRGEVLSFGGQVIKNVAGYDVSRLLCGSLGSLGVILEVSIRVSPVPVSSVTLRLSISQKEGISQVNKWLAQALPIDASVWHEDTLILRLSGARAAVQHALTLIDGEPVEAAEATAYWDGVRHHTYPFFARAREASRLWRVSVPPTTSPQQWGEGAHELVEWHGGLRWVHTADPAAGTSIQARAQRLGGHATCFYGTPGNASVFTPLRPPLDRLHRQLKKAFDPADVFLSPLFTPLSS